MASLPSSIDVDDDIMNSDVDKCVMIVRNDSDGETGRFFDTADRKRLRFARRNRNAISFRVIVSVVGSVEFFGLSTFSSIFCIEVSLDSSISSTNMSLIDETCLVRRDLRVGDGIIVESMMIDDMVLLCGK